MGYTESVMCDVIKIRLNPSHFWGVFFPTSPLILPFRHMFMASHMTLFVYPTYCSGLTYTNKTYTCIGPNNQPPPLNLEINAVGDIHLFNNKITPLLMSVSRFSLRGLSKLMGAYQYPPGKTLCTTLFLIYIIHALTSSL